MSFLDNLKLYLGAQLQSTPTAAPQAPPAPSPHPPLAQHPMVSDAVHAAYEALLGQREGRRNVVYRDSLGKPTGGIGHLILPADNMQVGDHITDAQIDTWFAKDGTDAMSHAVAQAAQAGITDERFLPYLASVCFQLGDAWTSKFPNTWAMICQGRYAQAAAALNGTAWHTQTPARVTDFQGALLRLPAKTPS